MALDLGRYGSREIMDLQIFNYSTKKPYLVFDYATSAQMENTAEVVYARGGRGNPRRISWHGDKETAITMETQIFTMQHLALLAGENIAKKNEDIFKAEVLTVQDDSGAKVVTLSKTPIGDVSVYSYKNGILVDDQPVLNVTGNEVTLGIDATVNAGEEVQVFYQWTATSAHTLNFTARGVPPYVFMVGDTLYADEVAGVDVAMQVKYYKARLQSNFTISFAPTGDPSTLSLVFDVFPVNVNGVDTLYTMSIYEDE